MAASSKDSASLAGKQRDRHLFENLPICILVADLKVTPAVIVEVNRRAALLYGYAAAELVGRPADQLVHEESRASVWKILQRVQRGGTVTAETTNRRRDGTTFPARVIATLCSHSGHMIATVEDITAEKQRRREPALPSPSRVHPLTVAEMAVLRLVTLGVDSKDIAQALNLSVFTVSNRLRAIFEKLSVSNRTQAALYALRQGWSTLDEPPR